MKKALITGSVILNLIFGHWYVSHLILDYNHGVEKGIEEGKEEGIAMAQKDFDALIASGKIIILKNTPVTLSENDPSIEE